MRHIFEHVFFPRKTAKVQFCYIGLLFSSKKDQMGHNNGQISCLKEVEFSIEKGQESKSIYRNNNECGPSLWHFLASRAFQEHLRGISKASEQLFIIFLSIQGCKIF